jgi:hypothetical protein
LARCDRRCESKHHHHPHSIPGGLPFSPLPLFFLLGMIMGIGTNIHDITSSVLHNTHTYTHTHIHVRNQITPSPLPSPSTPSLPVACTSHTQTETTIMPAPPPARLASPPTKRPGTPFSFFYAPQPIFRRDGRRIYSIAPWERSTENRPLPLRQCAPPPPEHVREFRNAMHKLCCWWSADDKRGDEAHRFGQ